MRIGAKKSSVTIWTVGNVARQKCYHLVHFGLTFISERCSNIVNY